MGHQFNAERGGALLEPPSLAERRLRRRAAEALSSRGTRFPLASAATATSKGGQWRCSAGRRDVLERIRTYEAEMRAIWAAAVPRVKETMARRAAKAAGVGNLPASIRPPAVSPTTQEMHDAGAIFRTLFRSAALEGVSTSQLLRVSGTRVDTLSGLQVDVRRRVAAALDALGGHDSPAGSCTWFVVGLEFSVRAWAARQGWGGRPIAGPVALGIVVGALGVLVRHFGLTPHSKSAA
jgi:hypothetical protein